MKIMFILNNDPKKMQNYWNDKRVRDVITSLYQFHSMPRISVSNPVINQNPNNKLVIPCQTIKNLIQEKNQNAIKKLVKIKIKI